MKNSGWSHLMVGLGILFLLPGFGKVFGQGEPFSLENKFQCEFYCVPTGVDTVYEVCRQFPATGAESAYLFEERRTYCFDESGQLTRLEIRNEQDSMISLETIEYKMGQPVERAFYEKGKLFRTMHWEYNDAGEIMGSRMTNQMDEEILRVEVAFPGSEIDRKEFWYFDGLLTSIRDYYPDRRVSFSLNSEGDTIQTTKIDLSEEGFEEQEWFFGKEGELLDYARYVRDDAGNLQEVTRQRPDGRGISSRVFRYNDRGDWVEKVEFNGKYDAETGKILLPEDVKDWEPAIKVTRDFEYGENGKWIGQKEFWNGNLKWEYWREYK